MSIEKLLMTYLDECDRLGVHGDVRAVVNRREELVARNGSVESDGETNDTVISLAISADERRAVLASGANVDPRTVVREGVALLRDSATNGGATNDSATNDAATNSAAATARASFVHPEGRSTKPIAALRDRLVAMSRMSDARECELRSAQTTRSVYYASPSAQIDYVTTYASMMLRATRSAENGEAEIGRAHV